MNQMLDFLIESNFFQKKIFQKKKNRVFDFLVGSDLEHNIVC